MRGKGGIDLLLVEADGDERQRKADMLQRAPDLKVKSVLDSQQALTACRGCRVDVVLFDPMQVPEGGVAFLRALRALCPNVRLIALAEHLETEQARTLVAAGIAGYLRKGTGLLELVEAIRAVHCGQKALSHEVLALLLTPCLEERPAQLTAREQELLYYCAPGSERYLASHARPAW